MPKSTPLFFNSSKEEKHDHIIYLNKNGEGVTNVENGHFHQVAVAVDENGKPIMSDKGTPTLLVGKAVDLNGDEVDTHVHEALDLVKTKKQSKTDEQDLVNEVLEHWVINDEYSKDWRDQAKESEDMLVPWKQWPAEAIREMKKKQKPALSLPFIATNVSTMVGMFMNQSSDISVVPVETGDSELASIVNVLFKYELSKNSSKFHFRKAFEDQLITAAGSMQVRLDFNDNSDGEIVVERAPWNEIYYGPHQLENQQDMQTVVSTKFVPLRTMQDKFPEKANELSKVTDILLRHTEFENELDMLGSRIFRSRATDLATLENDIAKIRVIELQKKEIKKIPVFVDEKGDQHNLELFSDRVVKRLASLPGVGVKKIVRKSIKITQIAGDVILFTGVSKYSDFYVGASYGIKRGKDLVSFVDLQKDQQRELNKRHSQLTHFLNAMAGSAILNPNGSIREKDKDTVKRVASGYGGIIDYDPTKGKPEKWPALEAPASLFNMMEFEYTSMLRAANMQGFFPKQDASGLAIGMQKRQALIGHEYQFENMRLLMERIGKVMLEMMDQIYFKNPKRAARILLNNSLSKKINPDNVNFTDYTEQQLADLLTRASVEKFDLVVSESPHSKTQREIDRMLLLEFVRVGAIRPEVAEQALIELSDISFSDRLLDASQSANQAAAEQSEQKNNVELLKSVGDDQLQAALIQISGIVNKFAQQNQAEPPIDEAV